MLKRLELIGESMITEMAQMEALTNNLANISTHGYKRDHVFVHAFNKQLTLFEEQSKPVASKVPRFAIAGNFAQGNLIETNRPLDMAISGEGFFVVETPQGEAYTRDGSFTLNSENILITVDGDPVLGEGGAIEINIEQNAPNEIFVNEKGEFFLDGELVDTLQILQPENPQRLVKRGANLFQLSGDSRALRPVENASIKQGFLEDSNVNPLSEMVSMLEILHNFEMSQRAARAQDEMLNQAASQIGRFQ